MRYGRHEMPYFLLLQLCLFSAVGSQYCRLSAVMVLLLLFPPIVILLAVLSNTWGGGGGGGDALTLMWP